MVFTPYLHVALWIEHGLRRSAAPALASAVSALAFMEHRRPPAPPAFDIPSSVLQLPTEYPARLAFIYVHRGNDEDTEDIMTLSYTSPSALFEYLNGISEIFPPVFYKCSVLSTRGIIGLMPDDWFPQRKTWVWLLDVKPRHEIRRGARVTFISFVVEWRTSRRRIYYDLELRETYRGAPAPPGPPGPVFEA